MDPAEIIAVSGFPRCGSSLMMRMLRAAGVRTIADHDGSMETATMLQLPGHSSWLHDCRGGAVKLLEVLHYTPPAGYRYRVIWMNRDPHEQVKSQTKFMDYLQVPDAVPRARDRHEIRRQASKLQKDTYQAIRYWHEALKAPVLQVSFERLMREPATECGRVCAYLGLPADRVAKMTPLIVHRSPKNYPGMLEIAMMGQDPNA